MSTDVTLNKDIETYYNYICTAVDRILNSLEGLSHEQMNWQPIPGETSSILVLATHTTENVRQAVLSTLGGAPDVRNRDAEFATAAEELEMHWVDRDGELVEEWERHPIHDEWDKLKDQMRATMAKLEPADLERKYEHPRRGPMTGWEVLLATVTHANEHAGHAELTRQLIDNR